MTPLIPTTPAQRRTRPDVTWIQEVCHVGHGAACCRYLLIGPEGWACAKNPKHHDKRAQIDRAVAQGSYTASGDNCEGRA